MEAATISFQSTRPSRGATAVDLVDLAVVLISIHAPLAGRDLLDSIMLLRPRNFNPHAPHGARRRQRQRVNTAKNISIHTPLTGRDSIPTVPGGSWIYFNPRAPCGARRLIRITARRSLDFNPRAPRGARHTGHPDPAGRPGISIHAPREGRDRTRQAW